MIVIHTGMLPSEEPTRDGLIVRETVHYPLTRRRIQEALRTKVDLEVFILTRVCDNWFWDLFAYHNDVVHVNDAPTERLKRKLSVSALPIDLATQPKLIVELGLLTLPDPSESVQDVWKWILRHKLGAVWAAEKPSKKHFSELVGWYIENTADPILQPKATLIAQSWIELASGKLRSAYARFFEAPYKSACFLITWKALEPYDRELREVWLATEGWYLQKLEDLAEMIDMPAELPKSIRDKLRPRVQTYWNSQLKGNND